MKDMNSVYWNMKSDHLHTLRSKKYIRRMRLQEKRGTSYLEMQEIRTLNYQIDLIDRITEARRANARFD